MINRFMPYEISARNSRFNSFVFLLIVILKTALESIKRFISIQSIGIFASSFTAQPSSLYGNLATYHRRQHATFQNNSSIQIVFSGLDGQSRSEDAGRLGGAQRKHPQRGRSQTETHSTGAKIGAAQHSKQGKGKSPLRPDLMKSFC